MTASQRRGVGFGGKCSKQATAKNTLTGGGHADMPIHNTTPLRRYNLNIVVCPAAVVRNVRIDSDKP